jgi:hypothetical protein
MNSRQSHLSVRPLWAAAALVCVVALALGFSSSPASARTEGGAARIVASNVAPAQPTAGQAWTVTFQVKNRAGEAKALDSLACMAQIAGKRVPAQTQSTDGHTGVCSWAVPSGSSGKMFDGVIAAHSASGTWYYAGFDLAIK